MANLQQLENSLTYYQGWYGTLSENGNDVCEPFPLLNGDLSSPVLSKEIPSDFKNIRNECKLTGSDIVHRNSANFFLTTQIIKELNCGHTYLIVLKKGTDNLTIPQFTFATAGTLNYEYKIRATV